MFNLTEIAKKRKLILGRNEWTLEYIRPSNPRKSFLIADNKIKSKQVLQKNGISVPALISVIHNKEEAINFDFEKLPKSFVIKPARGVKGGGVEIFYNKTKDGRWIRSNGSKVSSKEIVSHFIDIIDGKFSLHNQQDEILIEERVKPHKAFRYHSYKGTPDVRIIVYNKVPVMGMLRLPTQASQGKANLDKGAIGAGIDMSQGQTTFGVSGKIGSIDRIPKTLVPVSGLKIPYWKTILKNSVIASEVSGLGFCAIDFLIDSEKGPLIVELNARPGLSIQFANKDGLRRRLKKVSGIKVKSLEHSIRLAENLFGGEIEESIENISGKKVIGIIEDINIQNPITGKFEKIKCKVDTGADRSSIDQEFLLDIGLTDLYDYINNYWSTNFSTREEAKIASDERGVQIENGDVPKHELIKSRVVVKSSNGFSLRPVVILNVIFDGLEMEIEASVSKRSDLEFRMIVGRKDLKNFLIDAGKKK